MVVSWHERAKAYEHALAKYAFRMASNDVLFESEATEIECSLLPSIKGEELAIEQEMTRLRAQLADLQSRKDTFSRLSDACRMLISPIRRLPADLILEVFKFRFAEDSAENGHAGRYHLFHVNEGPWVFSHVCTAWRRAMLSFPSVWSNFLIDSERAPQHHYMFYLELVLERSRAHPLDFSFAFWQPWKNSDDGRNEMFTALIRTSRRWRSVTLVLCAEGTKVMSGVSPLALPALEHIDLAFERVSFSTEVEKVPLNLIDMLCRAPKLVDVALEGNGAFPVTSIHLPLAQLRRLAIRTNYVDEPPEFPQVRFDINLIQACPSLTSIDMSYYKWRHGQVFLAEQVITHKTVSTLRISDTALLPSFNFPSLIDLSIKPQEFGITNPGMAQDILVFLERTQCKLQKLSFKNLDCATTTTTNFYAILRDFGKTITELSIEYDNFYPQYESTNSRLTPFWCGVFYTLVVDPDDVLLPALESFTMMLRCQDISLWEELADFIESRWDLSQANVARLKKVVFGAVDARGHFMHVSSLSCERYKRFKEEGLDLEIWTKTYFARPNEPKRTVISEFGGEAWQYHLV